MGRGILSMMFPRKATAPSPVLTEVNPSEAMAAENWPVFVIVAPCDSLLKNPLTQSVFSEAGGNCRSRKNDDVGLRVGVVAQVVFNGLVAPTGLCTGDRALFLPTVNVGYFLVADVNQRHATEWTIDVFNIDVRGYARQKFRNGAKCPVVSRNGC